MINISKSKKLEERLSGVLVGLLFRKNDRLILEDIVALVNNVDVLIVWLILELVDTKHLYISTSYVSESILL